MTEKTIVLRLGDHRYVVATDYGQPLGMGRSGVWVPQKSGGWWTGQRSSNWRSVERTIRSCPDPVTYRTKRDALATV
jgi:hypothetical protein